ncbi:MAG: fibronectin type III domain-containing protein [Nitrospirota bacterium]
MNLLVIMLISIISLAPAYAGSDWNITLKVSGGGIYDYCIAGVKADATDGFDNLWDIPSPPASLNTAYINTYFPHPEWNHVFDRFRQDIKSPDLPKEWTFEVASNISGYLTIQWSDLRNIIPDKEAVLGDVDGGGGEIDMHTTSSFIFLNNNYPRKFMVKISQSIERPSPPQDLKAEVIKRNSVLLHWKKNHELDLAGYNVYRSAVPGGAYQRINDFLISEHKFADEQTNKGKTYYYVVTAVNESGGESRYSNEIEVTVKRGK